MYLLVRTCAVPVVFAAALAGQTRLSVADAVSQALTGNPRLAVGAAHVKVAKGLREQAGLAPNPRLIVQFENTRIWESPPFSYPRDTQTYALWLRRSKPPASESAVSSLQRKTFEAAS